jgi:benzoylsuccinyl-CoA thiolase BbsA subunit
MLDTMKKEKDEDMTFYHPELLEMPQNGPPYLKGYRCKRCGKLWFPKFMFCPDPDCWSEDLEVTPLSRRGEIYSATDVYIGQLSMRDYVPLIVGYVDLPEGIRIFSQLEGEIGSFKCGDEVELVTGPVRSNRKGESVISYKFKKVS